MKIFRLALFLLPILSLSCQSDSKTSQNDVHQTTFANFYLRYMQPEKKVKAEAFFRTGDSIKESTATEYKQGVRFDGGAMEMKKVIGRKLYKSERTADFNSAYKFEVDPGGDQHLTYELKINPIANFKIINGVSKAKGIELSWDGSALSKKEQLVLLFSDSQNRAFNINIDGPTENTTVNIPKEKLDKMKYGKGSLYLVRKFKDVIQSPGQQINAASEFYTNAIDIEVIE